MGSRDSRVSDEGGTLVLKAVDCPLCDWLGRVPETLERIDEEPDLKVYREVLWLIKRHLKRHHPQIDPGTLSPDPQGEAADL